MSQNNGMVCNFRNLQKQVTGKENKMPVVVFNPLSIDMEQAKALVRQGMDPEEALDASITYNNVLNCKENTYYLVSYPVTDKLSRDDFYINLPKIKDSSQVCQITIFLMQMQDNDAYVIFQNEGEDKQQFHVIGEEEEEVTPILFQDGMLIEPGGIYEINALYNGHFWTLAALTISQEEGYYDYYDIMDYLSSISLGNIEDYMRELMDIAKESDGKSDDGGTDGPQPGDKPIIGKDDDPRPKP